MSKRVIQPATSASRRSRRVEKPSTPWVRGRLTDVPPEIVAANPDAASFRWVAKGKVDPMGTTSTRIVSKRNESWTDVKLPKDGAPGNNSASGGYHRKDCVLMKLSAERKAARDYYVQERAEQHLKDSSERTANLARSKGFLVKEDSLKIDD